MGKMKHFLKKYIKNIFTNFSPNKKKQNKKKRHKNKKERKKYSDKINYNSINKDYSCSFYRKRTIRSTIISNIFYEKSFDGKKMHNSENCYLKKYVSKITYNNHNSCNGSEIYTEIRLSKLYEAYDIPSVFSLSCSSEDSYDSTKSSIINEYMEINGFSEKKEGNNKHYVHYDMNNNENKYYIFGIELNGAIVPYSISDICEQPIIIGGINYKFRTSKLITDKKKFHHVSIQCANDYQLLKNDQKLSYEIRKYIDARIKYCTECNEIAIRIVNYLDDKYEHLIIGKCIINFCDYSLSLSAFKLLIR